MTAFAQVQTKCEYTTKPLGIQTKTPRFSWTIIQGDLCTTMQKSYRITVAKSEQALADNDLSWDSGVVISQKNNGIYYEGTPLESATRYFYQVHITLEGVEEPVISDIDWFETALLEDEDWQGEWIGDPSYVKRESPLFLKQFEIDGEIESARAYICGLGYYELSLNGEKVGDRELDPGWTDYNKRVLYSVYDITASLRQGKNAVGVMLGEGWYGHEHPFFHMIFNCNPSWFDEPRLLLNLRIRLANGKEICVFTAADGTWHTCKGPIVMNNIYDGETYDARLEKDGWNLPEYVIDKSEWQPAKKMAPPPGKLECQLIPPIRQNTQMRPKVVYRPDETSLTYDMGKNIAGWVQVRVRGPKGAKLTIKYAENINADNTVNQQNLRLAKACDTYICKGEYITEIYRPRFTYHGFRYVQVTVENGARLENLVGYRVNTDVERVGHFECSSPMLNKIYETVVSTEQSNMHSIPTDCPQRDERLAWINDMAVRFEQAMFNFDVNTFYQKWMRDIADAQKNSDTGAIPDTAPFFYGTLPATHISSTYVLVPWFMYLFYRDDKPLKDHYEGMKKYVEFKLTQLDEKGLVNDMYAGDWAPPMTESIFGFFGDALPANIDNQLVTTCYLYYDLKIMQQAAKVLNLDADAAKFEKLANEVKLAINDEFLDKENGTYLPNSQGSNVFPLFLGIVPEEYKDRVAQAFIKDLVEDNDYHITTGNQTTKYVFETLGKLKRNDIAIKVLEREDYPSFGYMFACGATAIWERWENTTGVSMNSHDHPMHGAFSVWYFKEIAGIRPADEALTGYVTIAPDIACGLEFAKASYRNLNGVISSYWRKEAGKTVLEVEIPWNTRAKILVPMLGKTEKSLSCNGVRATKNQALNITGITAETAEILVGPGKYVFELA